jgi:hypothetical protein|tara:strand:- start:166 stop:300 length:135 start_codon:yes stop_codon:yes gene_type:complete
MEKQQLMEREAIEIEEKVARIKENIEKIRQNPKAMKEIEQLIAN